MKFLKPLKNSFIKIPQTNLNNPGKKMWILFICILFLEILIIYLIINVIIKKFFIKIF
jgi:hypothetical protein